MLAFYFAVLYRFRWVARTDPTDRQVEVLDLSVLAEHLVEVVLVDILGQALDDDLCRSRFVRDVDCAVRA